MYPEAAATLKPWQKLVSHWIERQLSKKKSMLMLLNGLFQWSWRLQLHWFRSWNNTKDSMHKVSSIAFFSWRNFNAPTPQTDYKRPIFNVARGRSSIDFWFWKEFQTHNYIEICPRPPGGALKFAPIHLEVHWNLPPSTRKCIEICHQPPRSASKFSPASQVPSPISRLVTLFEISISITLLHWHGLPQECISTKNLSGYIYMFLPFCHVCPLWLVYLSMVYCVFPNFSRVILHFFFSVSWDTLITWKQYRWELLCFFKYFLETKHVDQVACACHRLFCRVPEIQDFCQCPVRCPMILFCWNGFALDCDFIAPKRHTGNLETLKNGHVFFQCDFTFSPWGFSANAILPAFKIHKWFERKLFRCRHVDAF